MITRLRKLNRINVVRIVVLLVLTVLACLSIAISGVLQTGNWEGFWVNLGTGFIGSAITFFLIDLLIGTREKDESSAAQKRREQINAISRLRQIHGDFDQERDWKARQAILQEMQELDLFRKANLVAINFSGADLATFDMSEADIQASHFEYADLRGTILKGADARGAHFQKAQLTGVDFSNAKLVMSDLSGTTDEATGILFAKFEGASLMGADFSNSVLQYSEFKDANLRHATGLSEWQLKSLASLCGATMPNGERYDGRYRLPGDLKALQHKRTKFTDVQAAKWYGVTLETYRNGQKWADEYLHKIPNPYQELGDDTNNA